MARGAVTFIALLMGLVALAPRAEAQASAGASAAAGRSVLDGVYTEAQAKRGDQLRTSACSACHGGSDWSGNFIRGWTGRSVDDLVEQLRATMPMDAPGSLRRQDYADIVAYMLSINGIPAGDHELKGDESLDAIRIEWKAR